MEEKGVTKESILHDFASEFLNIMGDAILLGYTIKISDNGDMEIPYDVSKNHAYNETIQDLMFSDIRTIQQEIEDRVMKIQDYEEVDVEPGFLTDAHILHWIADTYFNGSTSRKFEEEK